MPRRVDPQPRKLLRQNSVKSGVPIRASLAFSSRTDQQHHNGA